MSYKGAGSAASAVEVSGSMGLNRKGAIALAFIAVLCMGLLIAPAMAKAAAPEVSLEQAAGQVDPTNDPAIEFTLGSNEALDPLTVTEDDFTVTNGTISSIDEASPVEFTINVTADSDGLVEIAPSGTFLVTDLEDEDQDVAEGADRSVLYDSIAPEASLQAAPSQDDPTSQSSIEFELVADEDLDEDSVDATDFSAANGSVDSVSGSGDTYVVTVTADSQGDVTLSPSGTFEISDLAGNSQDSTNGPDPSVLYDLAPVVSLQQADGQADPANTSPIEFSLTANEDLEGSSIEASDFDVTNGSVSGINGGGDSFIIEVTPAGQGTVSIAPSGTFSVDDLNGNFPATEAGGTDRAVTYDSVAPVASIDSTPADPSRNATPTFGISADETSDLECRVYLSAGAPSAWDACEDPYESSFLPAGDYRFELRATDAAGNVSATESYDWTVEASGITGSQEDLYFTRGAEPVEYRILAEDDQPGPLSYTFLGSVGNGTSSEFTIQPDGATATFTPGNGFAGTDELTIRVRNTDTNAFTDIPVEVVVRPATRLLTGPGADQPLLINDSTPTFTYDAITGPDDGVVSGATFSCRVDGVTQNASVCSTGSFTTANLADGEHTFWVRAAKPGINVDPQPQEITFTVDTVLPDVPTDLDGPSGLTNINDATYTFQIPEGSAQCRLISDSDPDPAFEACASPKEYTDVPDGAYLFEVRTRDNAGNVSAAVSLDTGLLIDTVVDVTIDNAPVDGNLDGKPAIEFSSDEDPDVDYECRLYPTSTVSGEEPAYESCTSPRQLPLLDQNISYTFQVRGTDDAGNTDVATAVWIQSNTAPAITEPSVTVEAGTTASVDLGGSDADSDVLTYTITSEVTGGTLGDIDQDNGTVDFTAGAGAVGEYTFTYSVSDGRQGGTTNGTATITVEPNTVFLTEPPAETNNTVPAWTFESPSGEATFECSFGGGAWEACDDGSYTVDSELAEGTYTLEVRATLLGLTDPTPASSTVIIDITAPEATITATPDALSNDTNPVFEFESTDASAIFECSIDEGDYVPCASGETLGLDLADGDHKFEVRAIDPATNVGTPDEYIWEVDATEPVIELGGAPEGVTNGPGEGKQTNAKRPVWYFERSDLNLDPDKVRCWIDSGTQLEPCVSPFQPSTNLADGVHTLHIEADDFAGNTGSFSVSFTVNTLSASVAISEAPASPSGPNAEFEFTSSTNLGPEGYFECRVAFNGAAPGAWATCTSPLSYTGLSSGTRKLDIRAVDSAGNASTGAGIASHTWTTVGGAPDTVITGSTKSGQSASFGFNSPGNPLATFECKLDTGAWSACTSPKTYTGLSTGAHSFQVRATNQVGTVDATPATNNWSVAAATAPNTNITRQPPARTTAKEAAFEFASSESVATFECRLNGGAWEACESPKSYTGLPNADHTFDVRSTSNGLTDQTPASVTWKVSDTLVDPPLPPAPTPAQLSAPLIDGPFKVKSGKPVALTVRTTNSGEQDTSAKVCLKTPKALVKGKAQRCKTVTVAGGATVDTTFKVKTKPKKKGKKVKFQVSVEYSSSGQGKKEFKGHVTLLK